MHVSFQNPDPEDPFPAMLPMIGFMASYGNPSATTSDPLDLYLHGYVSSRLMRLGATSTGEHEGLPVTVGATHLDGLVLALTPNNHSYNYRSVVLHGFASPVIDAEEKLWAMEKITNSVVTDRWNNTRVPPTKTEMTSTQVGYLFYSTFPFCVLGFSAIFTNFLPYSDNIWPVSRYFLLAIVSFFKVSHEEMFNCRSNPLLFNGERLRSSGRSVNTIFETRFSKSQSSRRQQRFDLESHLTNEPI